MYDFLKSVPTNELVSLLPLGDIEGKLVGIADHDSVTSMLFAMFGYEVLKEERARRMLLSHSDTQHIIEIAKALRLATNGKTQYDIATEVASLPWGSSSKVQWEIARILDISREYLPSRFDRLDAVESVEPRETVSPLFDYQEELVSKIAEFFSSGKSAGLLQLPTGAGKTRTAISAVIELFRSEADAGGILWMAHTEELCEQALETFRYLWVEFGPFEIRAGRFWGSYTTKLPELYGQATFGGFQKLLAFKKRKEGELIEYLGSLRLVIIDEAHKALGKETAKLVEQMKRVPGLQVLGLSATPGRSAASVAENRQLSVLFESNLISSDSLGNSPIQTLQRRQILSEIDRRVVKTGISVSLSGRELDQSYDSVDLPSAILRRLARNIDRNRIILEEVFEAAKDDRQVLVFACSTEHARLLALNTAAAGIESAYIAFDTRRSTRRQFIREFRRGNIRVMFNFGVLTTGFDAPNVSVVIIARPTSSIVLYSQMLGRGMRGAKVGGGLDVQIVDITDNFDNFGTVEDVYGFFGEYWK